MMSNWFKHGRTDLCAGFQQQGNVCEGGNCEHLKEGDQAYGYSSENDSFGSEYYLMCESCFEEFLEKRKKEPVECYDCKAEVPRNTTKIHIPYFVDEEPRSKWAKIICSECQTKGPHLRRLERDEEERSHDQQNQDDWFDEHGPDDEPDDGHEPEVEVDPNYPQLDKPFLSRVKLPKSPRSIFTDQTIITALKQTFEFPRPAKDLASIFPGCAIITTALSSPRLEEPLCTLMPSPENKNTCIKRIVIKRKIK